MAPTHSHQVAILAAVTISTVYVAGSYVSALSGLWTLCSRGVVLISEVK